MGSYTPPIPYDADPGYLKWALECNDLVGSVRVIMDAGSDGTPVMCGSSSSSPVTTTIIFNDHFGPLPPIALHYNNTGPTRMFPAGGDALALDGGTPLLRMVTYQQLTCPVCPACSGNIYLTYGDTPSISSAIDITANKQCRDHIGGSNRLTKRSHESELARSECGCHRQHGLYLSALLPLLHNCDDHCILQQNWTLTTARLCG